MESLTLVLIPVAHSDTIKHRAFRSQDSGSSQDVIIFSLNCKELLQRYKTIIHHTIIQRCCACCQLCPTLVNPMDCSLPGSSVHGDCPGKNIGVGCHAHLQRIFPTQGLSPGLPQCGHILYHLNRQRNPIQRQQDVNV